MSGIKRSADELDDSQLPEAKRIKTEETPQNLVPVEEYVLEGLTLYEMYREPREIMGSEDQSRINVAWQSIAPDLTCYLCESPFNRTYTTMKCLHRFCFDCISKYLRIGRKECPKCCSNLPSTRFMRPDPNIDALLQTVYPGANKLPRPNHEAILDKRIMLIAERRASGPPGIYDDLDPFFSLSDIPIALRNRLNITEVHSPSTQKVKRGSPSNSPSRSPKSATPGAARRGRPPKFPKMDINQKNDQTVEKQAPVNSMINILKGVAPVVFPSPPPAVIKMAAPVPLKISVAQIPASQASTNQTLMNQTPQAPANQTTTNQTSTDTTLKSNLTTNQDNLSNTSHDVGMKQNNNNEAHKLNLTPQASVSASVESAASTSSQSTHDHKGAFKNQIELIENQKKVSEPIEPQKKMNESREPEMKMIVDESKEPEKKPIESKEPEKKPVESKEPEKKASESKEPEKKTIDSKESEKKIIQSKETATLASSTPSNTPSTASSTSIPTPSISVSNSTGVDSPRLKSTSRVKPQATHPSSTTASNTFIAPPKKVRKAIPDQISVTLLPLHSDTLNNHISLGSLSTPHIIAPSISTIEHLSELISSLLSIEPMKRTNLKICTSSKQEQLHALDKSLSLDQIYKQYYRDHHRDFILYFYLILAPDQNMAD